MNRKINIKNKKPTHQEKHIQVAKTLSQAVELTDKLDETNRDIHDMMRKFSKNAKINK